MAQARRADELLEHYSDPEFQARFVRCWAVRGLLSDCVLLDDWDVPESLSEAVVLSPEGTEWAAWCVENGLDWTTATVTVFTAFARESLFVEVERTDVDSMLRCISDELGANRIRIPNPFGREADDTFGRLFGEWRDDLSRNETRQFLKHVPQGIAQLGDVVFGPLGVLISVEHRLLDVERIGAGFYCTDPGCDMLHGVHLSTGESKPADALDRLNRELRRTGRRHSEWAYYFRRVIFPPSIWESDRFTRALPELIANCLSDAERGELLTLLLRSGGTIRAALHANAYGEEYADKHAEEIVTAIAPEAIGQCILVESDAAIVRGIEELLGSGRIIVPATETRTSPFSRAFLASGLLHSSPELSSLGVRFLPLRRQGLDQLRTFFRDLYQRSGSSEELDWNLRNVSGDSPADRLNRFLLSAEPTEVFRALVFDSPARLRAALELVGPGDYAFPPESSEAEARLIRILMWKLGLDVEAYPEYLSRFHDRRRKFALSVKSSDALPPESERDEIRGAGSNLFVALEEVLDATLAFSSWALTFDHFGSRRNRFEYTLAEARIEGFEFINGQTGEGVEKLDPSGINTLAPLSAGFAHLADILRAIDQEGSLYRRGESELPQWADASPLEVFPFRHTVPWLDLTSSSRARTLAMLDGVPKVLSRNDVARVRNQTTHRRDEFPTGSEVRQVCDALGHLVADLEEAGLAPDVFTRQGLRSDAYGRNVTVLSDYFGREIELATPSEIRRSGVPSNRRPQVIFRSGVIEGTSEPLRFSVVEDSEFRRMWLGWPTVVQAPARQPETDARGGILEVIGSPTGTDPLDPAH